MALMVLRKKKKERKFAVAGSEPPLSFFRLFFVKDVRQRSVVCVRGRRLIFRCLKIDIEKRWSRRALFYRTVERNGYRFFFFFIYVYRCRIFFGQRFCRAEYRGLMNFGRRLAERVRTCDIFKGKYRIFMTMCAFSADLITTGGAAKRGNFLNLDANWRARFRGRVTSRATVLVVCKQGHSEITLWARKKEERQRKRVEYSWPQMKVLLNIHPTPN